MTTTPTANAGLIWSIAELLRGDYKQSDYGQVILPFTLLRRLDGVLAPTKGAVLAELAKRKDSGLDVGLFHPLAALRIKSRTDIFTARGSGNWGYNPRY